MARSSIKYIDAAKISEKRRPSGAVSSPVVYGRFPKRITVSHSSPVDKFNKFLSFLLFLLVMLSLVSYWFVSDSEKTMNTLGKEIVALNNENIELQNKLDNLHSFNKVDSVIQGKTSLDTAKKVIEIPAGTKQVNSKKFGAIPVNYRWTTGY